MAKKANKESKVEPMPGLVFNEAPAKADEPAASPWSGYDARHQRAQRWMWTGVITLSVIIVGLWGWSLKLQMAFFGWSDFKENKLISQTKADWNTAFSTTQKNDLQDAVDADRVRITLQNIISKRLAIAATIVSSTPATATTTVKISTTTPKTFPTAKKSTKK